MLLILLAALPRGHMSHTLPAAEASAVYLLSAQSRPPAHVKHKSAVVSLDNFNHYLLGTAHMKNRETLPARGLNTSAQGLLRSEFLMVARVL